MPSFDARFFMAAFSVYLVPSLSYVVLNQSSLAFGIVVILPMIVIALYRDGLIKLNDIFLFTFCVFLILMSFGVLRAVALHSGWKPVISYVSLLGMFVTTYVTASYLIFSRPSEIFGSIALIVYTALIFALLSSKKYLDILGYEKYHKYIFPHSEPSHFVLSIAPFLLTFILLARGYSRFVVFTTLLVILYAFPSVILVLALLGVVLIFVFAQGRWATFLFLGAFGVAVVIISQLPLPEYYLDRVNFSSNNDNVTVLVYLQGWEQIALSLTSGDIAGIGFQQAANAEVGTIGYMLADILGTFKNREDLGFLFAKLVVEFGYIALLFLATYLVAASLALRYVIRLVQGSASRDNTAVVFFSSCIITFFLEFLFRGVGYFSPGVFWLFVGVFGLLGHSRYKMISERSRRCFEHSLVSI